MFVFPPKPNFPILTRSMFAINPPMQPLIAAITAKNDITAQGKKRTNAPTMTVPATLAIAEAPIQHIAQQALCLESKKKASIAKPGTR